MRTLLNTTGLASQMGRPAGGRSRRRVSAGSAAAMTAGVVAACGGAGTEAPKAAGPASGTVSWMYSINPQTSGFDKIEEAFKAKFPNDKLDVLHTPDGYDDKLLAAFSAGNPPDVLRLNDDYILGYKTKNLI